MKANQRLKGERGKRLQRSEVVERSFAHVCETGGARRTWLPGVTKVVTRYLVQVAAHNLALLMRKLFGVGKPRTLQGAAGSGAGVVGWLSAALYRRWDRRAIVSSLVRAG